MKILLLLIKITGCVFFTKYICAKTRSKDTSVLQGLITNNTITIKKIFSPTQLSNIEISFKKFNIPYNTASLFLILVCGILISLTTFFICIKIFPIISLSLIVSIPMIFLPVWIINFIAKLEQNKLETELSDFFIQLKSSLSVNSDIIDALRRIQNCVLEPFSGYTRQLLNEINAGKLPDKALECFAQKINIKKFSMYINNVRYCHIYGGDISYLTEKTQKVISEAIKQKRKREKETNSICIVLYMLIAIDLYMYFYFIAKTPEYLNIMIESFIGQIILNLNFLSLWGVVWLSTLVKKMEY